MKRITKFALATLAAAAIATVPFACDKDGASAKAGAKAGGCNHGGAEAAKAGAGGCNHAAEAKAEHAGGCAHAAGAQVALAKYEDQAGGCPFHSKATEAQRAALEKGEKVTLVGYVVCAACDLKQEKSCKSIFKTESGEKYAIVGNDAFEKLAEQTMHGEKKVEIVGTTGKDQTESLVLLSSYKLVG